VLRAGRDYFASVGRPPALNGDAADGIAGGVPAYLQASSWPTNTAAIAAGEDAVLVVTK